jgi:hypothetical protein
MNTMDENNYTVNISALGLRNRSPGRSAERIFAGLKMIGLFALLVAGFCGCASTEVQKSSAEKEREAWYSNYVDNMDEIWGEHL